MLKYIKQMPQKVYLHRKYNNTINQKINIIEEIKEIEKNKGSYRKWVDQTYNSTMKNANFTKVIL